MTTQERREAIVRHLQGDTKPVSAAALAQTFGVSRQVVVGDVALLRASGMDILATPRGYVLAELLTGGAVTQIIACTHSATQMEEELLTIVDNGGRLENVIVEHPVYGQLAGELRLSSRFDVQQFIRLINANKAAPLSSLTDGIHLHTISCQDKETLERILSALQKKGFLLNE